MPKMNILLCGGGTGGHYYPLMAIKQDLHSKSDFRFSFVGAKKGIFFCNGVDVWVAGG